jgi:glycosyltransferase involved in cell wall biosynthesis
VVKDVVFAVPGDLATPTGGYTYDRRIIAELPALGWRAQVLDLGAGFPRPTPEIRADACAKLVALTSNGPVVVDGLALGVLPDAAEALHANHPLVALVHHPLALESGLSADEAAALRQSERTARLLAADYGVAPDRLAVVEPGTDRPGVQPRESGELVALLSVGAVVPRKGYDVLVAALARLAHLPWRLVIAGDCARSPETLLRLEADIVRFGLAERVTLLGAVTAQRLAELYPSADLFVLASRFEGYGMAYTEALAHGVPVVGTTAGAIPETVPAGAGVLVPPDDVDALAAALRQLIEHPDARRGLAAGARALTFPSWREQAALFVRALDGFA